MTDQEAMVHAKQLIEKCMFSSFSTIDEKGCPQSRAMMTAATDDDLTVYYITSLSSEKCKQITANPNVSSLWSDVTEPMTNWESVLLKGQAKISNDKALKERFWMEQLRGFFPEGVDDPNFVILVVKPTEMILADAKTMPKLVVKL